MSALPALTAPVLGGATHAFFTRQGGVSTGVYASLNGGVGSNDDPQAVAENRRRMAETLGVAPTHFLVPFQIHSAEAIAVSSGPFGHFGPALRAKADQIAIVSKFRFTREQTLETANLQ